MDSSSHNTLHSSGPDYGCGLPDRDMETVLSHLPSFPPQLKYEILSEEGKEVWDKLQQLIPIPDVSFSYFKIPLEAFNERLCEKTDECYEKFCAKIFERIERIQLSLPKFDDIVPYEDLELILKLLVKHYSYRESVFLVEGLKPCQDVYFTLTLAIDVVFFKNLSQDCVECYIIADDSTQKLIRDQIFKYVIAEKVVTRTNEKGLWHFYPMTRVGGPNSCYVDERFKIVNRCTAFQNRDTGLCELHMEAVPYIEEMTTSPQSYHWRSHVRELELAKDAREVGEDLDVLKYAETKIVNIPQIYSDPSNIFVNRQVLFFSMKLDGNRVESLLRQNLNKTFEILLKEVFQKIKQEEKEKGFTCFSFDSRILQSLCNRLIKSVDKSQVRLALRNYPFKAHSNVLSKVGLEIVAAKKFERGQHQLYIAGPMLFVNFARQHLIAAFGEEKFSQIQNGIKGFVCDISSSFPDSCSYKEDKVSGIVYYIKHAPVTQYDILNLNVNLVPGVEWNQENDISFHWSGREEEYNLRMTERKQK